MEISDTPSEIRWNRCQKSTRLGPPYFLSSCFSSDIWMEESLNGAVADAERIDAIGCWNSKESQVPDGDDRFIQAKWDEISIRRTRSELALIYTSEIDAIHFTHNSVPEAGMWLDTIPSPLLGTLLENDHFHLALGQRIGVQVRQPHRCLCPKGFVDERGLHPIAVIASHLGDNVDMQQSIIWFAQ
jgi:hypothetical protein